MLKISGGTLRGRRIATPPGDLRPTQEKVRQALFSALGPVIPGCRFLDLFAGSGAVGLEAASRGAGSVCWVESDRRVFRTLRDNVAELCVGPDIGGMRPVCGDAVAFLKDGAMGGTYDIIFADPPYADDPRERRNDWLRKTLQALKAGPILAPKGVFVAEQGADEPVPAVEGWAVTWDRTYGGTRLRFFEQK